MAYELLEISEAVKLPCSVGSNFFNFAPNSKARLDLDS
ncbi:hypothetical protein CCACVL1_18745 [Corchorus capsularis]|uniref:Uncharacterized protein n=1 Tax=Corchorus capsularis TaxID=210143 RepID=A0A1R3HK16_COCAP|nr:hypothetical protein CCACVL1_18745 [Corchorus capsularis]